MILLAGLLGLWWLATVGLLLGSAGLACRHPWKRGRAFGNVGLATSAMAEVAVETDTPISILVPLREESEAESEANAALMELDYPACEILFSAKRRHDDEGTGLPPQLRGEGFRVAFIPTTCRPGWNPKLANLVEPIVAATYELILVKDAATFLPPHALRAMIAALGPGVGLVSAIPIARRPRGFAAQVEAALINTYGARMLSALSALGGGAGIGAAMLFRRGDLERAGGLSAIGAAIADDHALAKLLAGLGLRIVLASATVDQELGARSLREIWRRHLRWAICRRLEEPLAFWAEPFTGLAAACLASLGAAHSLDIPPVAMLLATMLLWPVVEILLAALRGWPLSPATPLAILARELAMPALWLNALLARRIVWGAAAIPVSTRRRP
ncbi:glycosyltransferase family 2 protein [Labrys okinawensis]|uniref:glycosyltransferase family 2 protein n=1 Tax=Labrys okinawensis TaxID=346911 RepID=UPI0039BD3047